MKMRDMNAKEREVIETTLVAFEQYVASFIYAMQNPGMNAPLNNARANLINKVEAFVKSADEL